MFKVGATFNQSIRTFVRNFVPFFILATLGIAVLLGAVSILVILYFGNIPNLFSSTLSDPAAWNQTMIEYNMGPGFFILIMILAVTVFLAINAAVVYGTIVDLRGKSAGLGECIRRGISCVPKALGISILLSMALAAIMFGGTLVASLFASPNSVLPAIIMMLTMTALFMLFLRWYVVIPALVVEQTGILEAFSRSASLTEGVRWKILGLVVLTFLISLVVSFVMALVQTALSSAGLIYAPLVIEFAVQAAYLAFSAVLIAVVYHDLRVAKEGLGSAEIASAFD